MLKSSLVLASLLAVPSLAHADELSAAPGTQPPAPVAQPAPAIQQPPQTDDWSNVSHINGQIVKVGERGDYLIKYKTTNISGNPFGLFFGYYDLAVAHALTQNFAIAGSLTGWSMDHGNSSGYQATVSVPLYFRRTFSGPYLEPGLIVRNSNTGADYSCNGSGSDCSSGTTWAGPEMLFGWQYTFDSGLNVSWAAGLAKRVTGDTMAYGSDVEVNGYFRVGYAF